MTQTCSPAAANTTAIRRIFSCLLKSHPREQYLYFVSSSVDILEYHVRADETAWVNSLHFILLWINAENKSKAATKGSAHIKMISELHATSCSGINISFIWSRLMVQFSWYAVISSCSLRNICERFSLLTKTKEEHRNETRCRTMAWDFYVSFVLVNFGHDNSTTFRQNQVNTLTYSIQQFNPYFQRFALLCVTSTTIQHPQK